MVVNTILGYLGSQIGSYFCKKKNAAKQDGNQPIFQFQNAIQKYKPHALYFFITSIN